MSAAPPGASGGPTNAPASVPPTAIVLAADEETRVLLRGLLRLNHFRVVGESDDPGQIAELVKSQRPQLLIADAGPLQAPLGDLVHRSRSEVEGLRVVLVTTSAKGTRTPTAGREADAVLVRPFRVKQFADALGPRPS